MAGLIAHVTKQIENGLLMMAGFGFSILNLCSGVIVRDSTQKVLQVMIYLMSGVGSVMRQQLVPNCFGLPLAILLLPALLGCTGAATHTPKGVHTTNNQTAGFEPDDLPPQQAAQAAATDLRTWHPFSRLSKFLGRKPSETVFLWRSLADVSLPGSDLANYPNSSYTLPRGGVYLESSPVGFYGASAISSSQWNWEYLLRYGLTDNIEFRMFSNGLTAVPGVTGFSPLAFDTKAHLWAAEWDWFNVSVGLEAYIQTTSWLASPALYSPLQYAFNLLVDHELPWGVSFEWNLGFVRQTLPGNTLYLPTFQWAFQRNITDDTALFIHGYNNADALPRVPGSKSPLTPSRPEQEAIGFGGQWSVNKQIAFYGSYNWGLTRFTPAYNANIGVAVSF